jgi:hypothetical protein
MKTKYIVLLILGGACLWLLFWPSEKDRLNAQMAELCKKDGGVKIYERMELPADAFNQQGGLKTPKYIKRENDYVTQIADVYELSTEIQVITDGDLQKGEGRLDRQHRKLVDTRTNKLLAEGVFYNRAGGDRWSAGMHSQSGCPENPVNIINEVFFNKVQQ